MEDCPTEDILSKMFKRQRVDRYDKNFNIITNEWTNKNSSE